MTASLIIPAFHAGKTLYNTTIKCLDSVWQDKLQLILIADNQPYTVNVNAGLRASTGDVVIVGNNDLEFSGSWLKELLSLIPEYDIATCWTSDQKVKLSNGVEEDAKFGSLFAMKREVYEKLGGFDEQFKGYFSDLDYRARAMDAGFKIGKKLDLVVNHAAKATYQRTDPNDNDFRHGRALFEAKYGYLE